MARPALSAVAELLKPTAWFTPRWALGCGEVAGGLVAGVRPTSRAANDGFDRHVDAINESVVPLRMAGMLNSTLALRSAPAAA